MRSGVVKRPARPGWQAGGPLGRKDRNLAENETVSQIDPGARRTRLAGTVRVVVRGLGYTCWKCHEPTTCIVALHAGGANQSDDWMWFEDKHALSLARELLLRAGQPELAATIKDRFSKTAGGRYLSNGCQHCNAIQGDWPLGHAVSDYALGGPLEELPVLATCHAAEAAWHDVVANRGMRRYGCPMTWEDVE